MMGLQAADRAFRYALAGSLAVHALVLFGGLLPLRDSPRPPPPAPPLVAHLAQPVPPTAAPPSAPAKPAPRREVPLEIAAPAPSVAAPATPVEARPAPPAPELPGAAAMTLQSPPAAAVAEGAPPRQSVDARAVEAAAAAQYRLQLIDAARRYKPPYPPIARENSWIGNVTLDVVIRADGRAELIMRRGSGYEILDRMALETFQQALRAVPVPPALQQGREVKLQALVVVYSLTD